LGKAGPWKAHTGGRRLTDKVFGLHGGIALHDGWDGRRDRCGGARRLRGRDLADDLERPEG